MSALLIVSRRSFLRIAPAAGAGLILGLRWPDIASASGPQNSRAASLAPNAFLQIDPRGDVTIWASKSEMGQGVRTSLAMIVAEELDADWSRVRVEQAWADARFGDQDTGGSDSVRSKYDPMRRAGAAARAMLIAAAARTWGVDPSSCRTATGAVLHPPTKRRLPYGDLVEKASTLPVPQDAPLKDPKDFRIIGRSLPRTDTPVKVDGGAVYGIDVRLDGMLHAAILRCPVFGGRIAHYDAAAAKASPGVRAVVPITTGLAVVADSTWNALKGRDALKVEWDEGRGTSESGETLRAQCDGLSQKPGKTLRSDGDAATALAGAAKRLEAVYELPFQAHATMEPQNATAHWRKDRVEVWAPVQTPSMALPDIANAAGLPQEAVTLHITYLGGGFGRRINADYAAEAVEISRATGSPVKTVWTRADDLQHDFYRPASFHRLQGGLDGKGRIVAWQHRIVSTSIKSFYAPAAADPEDEEKDGAADLPYGIPNVRVEYAAAKSVVPRGWWRSVGNSFNAFAIESFLDELAAAARRDPLALRRDLLSGGRRIPYAGQAYVQDTARLLGVLNLAAAKAGWGRPLPKGRARGVASHFSFQSYCAEVAEVSTGKDGGLRVHRVVCAIDCGRAVNPGIIAAQMESAVVFGLTAALKSGITIDKGRVKQANFDDYEMLRIDEMPAVEVHVVPSTEPPTGVGEPGVPVVAPAVFNALFAATGKRIRRLPLQPADLLTTA